jgi:SRSO17 transposase
MPPERTCATQPQRAKQMLARACDAAVPAAWVAGDSVYGEHRPLREWLAERPQA